MFVFPNIREPLYFRIAIDFLGVTRVIAYPHTHPPAPTPGALNTNSWDTHGECSMILCNLPLYFRQATTGFEPSLISLPQSQALPGKVQADFRE